MTRREKSTTHITVCQSAVDKSVTMCGLLLAIVSVFPHKLIKKNYKGITSKTICFKVKKKTVGRYKKKKKKEKSGVSALICRCT